jgi:hypothetical protein
MKVPTDVGLAVWWRFLPMGSAGEPVFNGDEPILRKVE